MALTKQCLLLALIATLTACSDDGGEKRGSGGTKNDTQNAQDFQGAFEGPDDANTANANGTPVVTGDPITANDTIGTVTEDFLGTAVLTVEFARIDNPEGSVIIKLGTKVKTMGLQGKEGTTVEVEDFCTNTTTNLEISYRRGGATYEMSNHACAVGKDGDNGELYAGFDSECDGSDWDDTDDEILILSCGNSSKVVVTGMKLNDNINLQDWF